MKKRNVAAAEGRIEAEIDLVFELQLLAQQLIEERGITRAELANRLGISKPRLSQMMRAEANPTVRTIAGLFHALGDELSVSLKSAKQAEARALGEGRAFKEPRRSSVGLSRQDEVLHEA